MWNCGRCPFREPRPVRSFPEFVGGFGSKAVAELGSISGSSRPGHGSIRDQISCYVFHSWLRFIAFLFRATLSLVAMSTRRAASAG